MSIPPSTPGKPWRSALALVVCVLLCFAAAGIGGLFAPDQWYADLTRPALTPPGWIFGPVWTVLYLLMAVAAWLVWRRRHAAAVALPLTVFALQLGLNAAWSWLFFGLHRPDLAFAEILVLWTAILVTVFLFRPVSSAAALLMLPYLAWVSFAAYLNLGFWRLNLPGT